jgi:hypothetical protein
MLGTTETRAADLRELEEGREKDNSEEATERGTLRTALLRSLVAAGSAAILAEGRDFEAPMMVQIVDAAQLLHFTF